MSAKPVFGIDVAKAELVIADAVDSPIIRLPNQIPTIRRWLKQLPGSCRFGWESTSDFHRPLVELAHAAGHDVCLLDPQMRAARTVIPWRGNEFPQSNGESICR
jgi:hypothetical protein